MTGRSALPSWRAGSGEDHPNAVLTAEKVREIRRRATEGESRKAIAASLGVAYTTVGAIIRREAWGGLP